MPRRDQTHFEFSRQQHGLGPFAAAQVANAINVRLVIDLLDQVGGEMVLPEGFTERVAQRTHVVVTRHLDDGRYRVWLQPMPQEHNHAGLGTRWERVEGSEKRGRTINLYEVVAEGGKVDAGGDGNVTLQRIATDGSPVSNVPLVTVPETRLLSGAAGWRVWAPPGDLVDELGGREF